MGYDLQNVNIPKSVPQSLLSSSSSSSEILLLETPNGCRSPSETGGCHPWRAACNRTRTPAQVWTTDWEAGTSSLNTGRTRQSRISDSGGGGWRGWISSSGSACTPSPQSRAPRRPRARRWEISRFFPVGPRRTCWCGSSTQTSPLL